MNNLFSQSWWMLTLRGILGILFGITALLLPMLSLALLLGLFAAYAILSGVVFIAGALRHRKTNGDWWLPFFFGVMAVGVGIVTFLHPRLTLLVLILLIGSYALISGTLDLAMAIHLRKTLRNEWLLLLHAVFSLLFGVSVFLMPDAGAMVLTWMIGVYALLSGCLLVALALLLRHQTDGERRYIRERRGMPDRRAISVS